MQKINYRAEKSALLEKIEKSKVNLRGIYPNLRRITQLADSAILQIWKDLDFEENCCLIAVGGYGRRELFPYSDIDVLLLLPDNEEVEKNPALKEKIENFISRCWDTGLEIGASVRTINECLENAAADITVQTSLLEARLLAGDKEQFEKLSARVLKELDTLKFLQAKKQEMRQRHLRQEDAPYALEPNCKESPGGLRDLHVITWVSRAAGIKEDKQKWQELAKAGLATEHEVKQLIYNDAVISLIRMRLHLVAKRREDRLIFDMQNAVANSFGLTPRKNTQGRITLRASEVLMQRYYWAVKAVMQLEKILLQGLEEFLRGKKGITPQPMRKINENFYDKGGLIEISAPNLYEKNHHAILETFLIYAKTQGIKGLSANTLRALYHARAHMHQEFRKDPVNRQTFITILKQPSGVTRTMRLMNQTSILGRYLWVFRKIVGQMQHDLFHVYTVDQHILMVLRNMRRFFMVEHAHEYPFCSQLAANWQTPHLLYIAALFHDIAKGRGGDHSELGAQEVERFCKQHGINGQDRKLISFLVQNHLLMSQVAQKQDISDPHVIKKFADKMQNKKNLTGLYLLTVADIRGTSPKVWNSWKDKLLKDLYLHTLSVINDARPNAKQSQTLINETKENALAQLNQKEEPKLWQNLGVRYFMRHDASDIAWHAQVLSKDEPEEINIRHAPLEGGLQVLIYTDDKPDLFARICAGFEKANLSVMDAKIHTTLKGRALDTFQITSTITGTDYEILKQELPAKLKKAINSSAPLTNNKKTKTSKRVQNFPITPQIELRPDEKAQSWLLNISTSDKKGLLSAIALVLTQYQINLELAKITTLGERAEDMFLIKGQTLQNPQTIKNLQKDLLQAITI